jgi:hypothetical protein
MHYGALYLMYREAGGGGSYGAVCRDHGQRDTLPA